jgi:3'-5' exoribonuclease
MYNGYCVIRKKELKYKKNGESYLKVEFGDSSGRLGGKIWSYAEQRDKNFRVGQIVKIQGKILRYNQTKEIRIERIQQVREDSDTLKQQLLPMSRKDVDRLKKQFIRHKTGIRNSHLKRLLQHIFSEKSRLTRYLRMPSGKLWHHQYQYGILEHLVCILDLADTMYLHYPALNLDLLKTGMIVNFLGNLHEFDQDGFINYSNKGRLLGHSLLSLWELDSYLKDLGDFPAELKIQLFHLIVSHDAWDDRDSQILPMTREALIMAHIRRLDIQANAVERIIENDKLEGSDWTKFNKLLNRFVYEKTMSADKNAGIN